MIDMGVPAYLVSNSVIAVMVATLGASDLRQVQAALYTPRLRVGRGRHHSLKLRGATFSLKGEVVPIPDWLGYRGRLGIFELMQMTSRIRELAFEGLPTQQIRKAAVGQGMSTLYNDGIRKVLKGVTTIEEVLRVAKKKGTSVPSWRAMRSPLGAAGSL